MARKTKPPVITYPTDLVFSAAAVAERINGGEYIKTINYGDDTTVLNNVLLKRVLNNELEITESDRIRGESVRTHFQGLSFKILKGDVLSDFSMKALELATAEEVSERNINFIACLPSSCNRDQKFRSINDRLADSDPKYVGDIHSKVSLTVEVVKAAYSSDYNSHYISGLTDDNLAIKFFFSKPLSFKVGDTIKLTGKVKNHGEKYLSHLNYVKIL